MDYGTWREPARPTPRPAGWGEKTRARALDHAERTLRANQRIVAKVGADAWKPITLGVLAGVVEFKARCSAKTALEAARLVMGLEPAPAAKVRVEEPLPRVRIAVEVVDVLDVDDDTAEIATRLCRMRSDR